MLGSPQFPAFVALIRSFPDRAGTETVRRHLTELASVALRFYLQSVPMGAVVQAEPALLARLRETVVSRGVGPHKANERVADHLRAEQALGRVNRAVDPDAASFLLLGACFQKAHWLRFLDEPAAEGSELQFAGEIVAALMVGVEPG